MKKQSQVLLVDDEEDLCTLMQMTLARMGITSDCAYRVEQAKALLKQNSYALCLTDLNMPDQHGMNLVEYVNRHYQQMPIAVLTAYGDMQSAIEALKAGAFDFINKPIQPAHLHKILKQTLQPPQVLQHEDEPLPPRALIGASKVMEQLQITVKKIARSQAPVFITGESGTGKEVVAHLIHHYSTRQSGPFIAINCGAIPAELIESELFGHKKGSFTGAQHDKAGLILSAQGGSLFLDEIAELALNMQVKLLRAIQEKKIRPVGSDKEIEVDFRVISASHQNLETLVKQGKFRQDLFFRIHVMDIRLPALRERDQDALLLAEHFIQKISQEWHVSAKTLTASARAFLIQYSFPGNVRELSNLIERAMTLSEDHSIDLEHLQSTHAVSALVQPVTSTSLQVFGDSFNQPSTLMLDSNADIAHATPKLPLEGLEQYLEKIEKEILIKALNISHWNRTVAARKLGMTFRSLRYRLKKFGLDTEEI